MEKHSEKLKNKLLEIYSQPNLNADELYNFIIYKQCNQDIESKYNSYLNNLCLYLYYKNNSLQTLTKNVLPFELERGLSFDLFCTQLEKYKSYEFQNSILQGDTYYDLIFRALVNRNRVIKSGGWKAIQKSNLENTENNLNDNFAYKIYLPIANESLELFSMRFLAKCSGRNVDYDFKINDNSSISRSDNVVIYATNENFNDYIKIIEDVIKNDSRIKINYEQQHLLAYPYNEYISIAPYTDYKGESFSSIICNEICELRKSCTSFDDFYNNVVRMINNHFNEFKNNQIKGSAKK